MGHNGGRACVNVDTPLATYYTAFLNVVKQNNASFQAIAGVTGDWRTLFDDRGYPIAMPGGGANWFAPQIYIYGQAGDTWVLDWPGTATMSLTTGQATGTVTENIVSANRREYTISGSFSNGTFPSGEPEAACLSSITITSMSANTFAGGSIRLYLKNGSPSGVDYETRINNGEIFDPRFTASVGPFGVVRFVNWTVVTNGNLGVGQWADRQPVDAFGYWGDVVLSKYWCGASSGTNAQVVSQPPSTISSWTQGQKLQWQLTNIPDWHIPTAVTQGNPTTFQFPAHGLATGDKIQFPINLNTGWRSMCTSTGHFAFQFWPVTVIDANNFSIPFDSTGAPTYPTGVGGNMPFTKAVTVKVGSLSAVPCVMQQFAGNFSPTGWDFGQTALTAGDIIDGIYDISLGAVLVSNGVTDATLQRRVPIEVIVAFCNANGCHCYFNINAVVSDDYVLQLATYLHANLAPGLLAMAELDNEIWNSNTTGYADAKSLSELGTPNFSNWYGKRSAEIAAIFKSVYGGAGSYQIMMGVQSAFGGPGAAFGTNPFVIDRMIDMPYCGIGVSSITIANPAVITTTTPHGRQVGDMMLLTTTGSLPAPFQDGVNNATALHPYYIVSAGFGASAMQLALTLGGSSISTLGGTQSGTHTIGHPPMADCDVLVHAPYFDSPILGFGSGAPPDYPNGNVAGSFADQVYNNSLGGGAQQAAFDFYKASLLNASLNETDYPSANYFYINKHLATTIPFWKSVATMFGKELHDYEGGQNVFGTSNQSGFPYTIAAGPNSGQTVTTAMVGQFMLDFYASQQFADCIATMFNGSAALGTKFPSQYTVLGPHQIGDYWAIQRLNTDANGFVDSPTTLAYAALLAFNNRPAAVAPLRFRLCVI